MNDLSNPYAAPDAETVMSIDAQTNAASYYVDGKNIVVRDGAELPNYCIKSGVPLPDGKRHKKTLYWAHPAWALLILAGLIVYAIVYLCVRKKVTLHYSLSPQVKKKRFFISFATLLATFGGIGMAVYFMVSPVANSDNGMYIVAGFIIFFVGLVMAAVFSNFLRPKKHNDGWFTIKGVGKEFLKAIQ